MYVMIKLLVNAITYCFLCARYNNKHFTNVGSFHPHDNPFSIIILILQMRTSSLKEFISQYRVGYAAETNTSRDLKHKIDLSLICPRCCLSENYSEQLFSKW